MPDTTPRGPFELPWIFWVKIGVTVFVVLFSTIALLTLRRRPMGEVPRFLWTLLIVFMPVVGPIIFCMVHPGDLHPEDRRYV